MSDDKPYFRFNPGAYEEGRSFKQSNETCEICSRACVWRYVGNIYAENRPTAVCARCIASGRLSECLHDIELENAEPSLEEEVLLRTPGVACFNPFHWPVLDSKPLAFLGYAEDRALVSTPEVQAAINDAFAPLGAKFEGPTSYALVFREVDGDRYRAVIDLD